MTSSHATAATSVTTAELTWLLSLRPGTSATLVASALAVPVPTPGTPPDPAVLQELVAAGRAQDRRGEILPRGESAVVGDVLTSASALISIGTESALVGLVVVGQDRVLVVAPAGPAGIEVAALDAATPPAAAAAALVMRVGPDPVVMVAVPGRGITTVEPGDGVLARVEELLP